MLIVVGGPPERFEYDDLARSVVAGTGYVYNQLNTPYRSFYAGLGYMAINIATDWLFPASPKAMLVVQSLYEGLLAWVIFQIARRYCDVRLAVAAAALALFHPAFLYYDTRKLHPLGFDSLMMMAALWSLLRLRDDARPGHVVLSGIVCAFAILQRGSMLLFVAGAVVWMLMFVARGSNGVRLLALYAGGLSLVIAPWAARNYAIHHVFMLESMTPQQFWKGNAPYSNGAGYLPDGRNVYDAAPESLKEEMRRLDEVGHFHLFRREALQDIRSDPARWVGLVLKKFVYFWTAPPNSGQLYPARYFGIYFAYYACILLAAAVGLAAILKRPAFTPDGVLILGYFASLAIVHALMFVEMRHRWAAEPLLLAFAPAGAFGLFKRLSGRA